MKVITIVLLFVAFLAIALAFYAHLLDGVLASLGTFYANNETIIKLAIVVALLVCLVVGFLMVFVFKNIGVGRVPPHTLSMQEILDDWRKQAPVHFATISKNYDLMNPKVASYLDDTTPTPRFYLELRKKIIGQPMRAVDYILLFDAGAVPNPLGSNRLKAWGDKELVRIALNAKDADGMAYKETGISTFTSRLRELEEVENPDVLKYLIPQGTIDKMVTEK